MKALLILITLALFASVGFAGCGEDDEKTDDAAVETVDGGTPDAAETESDVEVSEDSGGEDTSSEAPEAGDEASEEDTEEEPSDGAESE